MIWANHGSVNLGRPRQMVPGQYIHRSVQKRLRFEQPLNDEIPELEIIKLFKMTSIRTKEKWIAFKSGIKGDVVVHPPNLVGILNKGTGYEGPRAELPTEFGFTWDDLRRGKGGLVWEE